MTYGRSLERHLNYFGLVDDGKSNNLFGMSNPGAGPRWLTKARHEGAFQLWKTAAAATSVRRQSDTKGEAEVPGAACPRD